MQRITEQQREVEFNEAYYFAKHKHEFCPACLEDGVYEKMESEDIYLQVQEENWGLYIPPIYDIVGEKLTCKNCGYWEEIK